MEMVKQGWVHLEEGPCKKLKGWSSGGSVIARPSLCGHSGRSVEAGLEIWRPVEVTTISSRQVMESGPES